MRLFLEAQPQFLRGDEAGADPLAPSPGDGTDPENLAARGKCETDLRHRQLSDLKANAVI